MFLHSDQYFNNDSLSQDLGRKTARGGIVTMSGQGIRFVLRLGSTMVLARLLTPDDFGLIGMVMIVVNFLDMLKEFGLSQATIQRSSITRGEVSNLFWVNLAVSSFLALFVTLCAPLVASFYGRSELTSLTICLGLFMVLQGVGLQHRALITRKMEFVKLALVESGAMLAGVIVAVLMSLYGFSYWALVGQSGAVAIASSLGCFYCCRWLPSKPSSAVSIRPYLKYGGNLAGFNLLNFFSRNADNIMIGYVWGAGSLGVYSKAYSLLMMPLQQINGPMTKVMLPVLSQLQDSAEEYRRYYLKAVGYTMALTFPIVGLFLASSHFIVLIFLGQNWLGAVPVFQALVPAAFISALNVTTGWVYLSLGTTHRQLKWTLLAAPLHVLAMLLGLRWGAIGVAWGVSISFCIVRIPYLIYTYKGTSLLLEDVLKLVGRGLCVVLPAAVLTLAATSYLEQFGALLGFVLAGALYGVTLCALDILIFRKSGICCSLFELKKYIVKR
jgi:O-antigen/teichoic acid export membrane protein